MCICISLCLSLFFSLSLTHTHTHTLNDRQMERQRQMRRCMEQRDLAQRTATQLATILSSCGYLQLLSKSVLDECKVVVSGLNAVQVELFNMEQSGVVDANKVSNTSSLYV